MNPHPHYWEGLAVGILLGGAFVLTAFSFLL